MVSRRITARARGTFSTTSSSCSCRASTRTARRSWRIGTTGRVRCAVVAFHARSRRFPAGSWVIENARDGRMRDLAGELGLTVVATERAPDVDMVSVSTPRIAMYQRWGSNMDEGWTRWLLDAFDFDYTVLHPQDFRAAGAGEAKRHQIPAEVRADWPPHVAAHAPSVVTAEPLADRFDVVVFTHQSGKSIVEGDSFDIIPEVYRGGIGEAGLDAVTAFLESGGTVVAMGDATELFIEHWPIAVHNAVGELEREDFLIPGSILKLQVDASHPVGWGMPRNTHGYFIRSPAFTLLDGFQSQDVSVVVRYPNKNLNASGWTRGEEHIAGRAAAVTIRFDGGGQLVLLGLRPQHRAQTHATFKLFFNALMLPRVLP